MTDHDIVEHLKLTLNLPATKIGNAIKQKLNKRKQESFREFLILIFGIAVILILVLALNKMRSTN